MYLQPKTSLISVIIVFVCVHGLAYTAHDPWIYLDKEDDFRSLFLARRFDRLQHNRLKRHQYNPKESHAHIYAGNSHYESHLAPLTVVSTYPDIIERINVLVAAGQADDLIDTLIIRVRKKLHKVTSQHAAPISTKSHTKCLSIGCSKEKHENHSKTNGVNDLLVDKHHPEKGHTHGGIDTLTDLWHESAKVIEVEKQPGNGFRNEHAKEHANEHANEHTNKHANEHNKPDQHLHGIDINNLSPKELHGLLHYLMNIKHSHGKATFKPHLHELCCIVG